MPSYLNLRNLGFGVAAAIPLTLAASHQAQAVPYAYASNTDSNFAITAVSGGTYAPSNGTFQTSNNISTSGFLPSDSSFRTGNGATSSDAPEVYSGVGVKPPENDFGQALTANSTPAIRADSFDSGFAGSGGNVAEGNFSGGPSGGGGAGTGKLNSNNSSTITVTVGAGVQLQISFNDDVGLQATSRNLSDESASAAISSSVSIQQGSAVLFSYTPNGNVASNGAVGGTIGGTDTSDPYNLNTNVAASGGGALISQYFQTGGLFTAITNPLPAGTYTININQQSNIDLSIGTPTQTPEPASLALLGAGLISLGVFRRNRKSS